MSETQLVKACLQLLQLRGVFCWRQNQGRARFNKRSIAFTSITGISDVLAIIPPNGTLLAIEAKVGKNKVTENQKTFMAAITRAGGHALEIRDIRELENFLNSAME